MSIRHASLTALCIADPEDKVQSVQLLWQTHHELALLASEHLLPAQNTLLPGRPALPRLIPPKQVPTRTPFTPEGLASLLHAVCHIEFNAINLALDAVWRFHGMPAAYYTDWLRVAYEESQHFELLRTHLKHLGYAYGDFDAHDGLWQMCERTSDDVLARMALVPRTLEVTIGTDGYASNGDLTRSRYTENWFSATTHQNIGRLLTMKPAYGLGLPR